MAGGWASTCTALGALRNAIARERDAIERGIWRFLWVVDFPLVEWDEEAQRWQAVHHPFTRPRRDHWRALQAGELEMAAVASRAYDVILNGYELGGGSLRIHDPDQQREVFETLGIGEAEAEERFGFFLEALRYGAPPHGGIALGLDRIVMLMAGAGSLREVIAFPKTTSATCLMTEAPTPVDESQLAELGLSVTDTGPGERE